MDAIISPTIIDQAPQIIPVITDDRDFYINIALATITLMAVIVALLQEFIRKFLSRANISVEIRKIPPDCHKILLTNSQTGLPIAYTIYSRIRITNDNPNNMANNVEVFISHFWRVNERGEKSEIQTFLPMNLKWSHTHETKTTVLPKFFRYCDFGSFRKLDNGSVILLLDTIVQPNPVENGVVPNIIEPGNYIFEIIVSGENITPKIRRWKISFNNQWHDDENEMINAIQIQPDSI